MKLYPWEEMIKAIEYMENKSREVMAGSKGADWNVRELIERQILGCWNLAADLELSWMNWLYPAVPANFLKEADDFAEGRFLSVNFGAFLLDFRNKFPLNLDPIL